MPQVKQLQELNVAGRATKEEPELDFFVQWHLTDRCNLRCKHCYQGGRPKDEMSLPEIREVAEEVSAMLGDWAETYGMAFSPSLNITGGEPFLRRDIFEVLEEMRARGFAVHVLTNGILVDRERARRLADLGVRGVQVSMEGPEEIHEKIRGKGSFARAFTGVRNLLEAGLEVTVNATLSRLNAEGVGELMGLAREAGVQRFGFSRLVPCGTGIALLDEMLDSGEVRELYMSLMAENGKGMDIVTGDPLAAQMDAREGAGTGHVPCGGCAAGLSGLTILPDGTVTPCRRLDIPIGNVRKDALREVWATSGVLNALRDRTRYRGKCASCKRWAACRGCRAIAYAYSLAQGEADYLAEDPQCFHK